VKVWGGTARRCLVLREPEEEGNQVKRVETAEEYAERLRDRFAPHATNTFANGERYGASLTASSTGGGRSFAPHRQDDPWSSDRGSHRSALVNGAPRLPGNSGASTSCRTSARAERREVGGRHGSPGFALEAERVDQHVQQEVAGAKVARRESDGLARGELERGARGRRGPAVDVQPHAQRPAEPSASEADLDPKRAPVTVVHERAPQPAPPHLQLAVVSIVSQPGLEGGHARLERQAGDAAERAVLTSARRQLASVNFVSSKTRHDTDKYIISRKEKEMADGADDLDIAVELVNTH
jgi:hypothetical protein